MTFDHFCKCIALPKAIRPRVRQLTAEVDNYEPFLQPPEDFTAEPCNERVLHFLWMVQKNEIDPDHQLDAIINCVQDFDDKHVYKPFKYVRSAMVRAGA